MSTVPACTGTRVIVPAPFVWDQLRMHISASQLNGSVAGYCRHVGSLMLGAHAHESYSSCSVSLFVCMSVCCLFPL